MECMDRYREGVDCGGGRGSVECLGLSSALQRTRVASNRAQLSVQMECMEKNEHTRMRTAVLYPLIPDARGCAKQQPQCIRQQPHVAGMCTLRPSLLVRVKSVRKLWRPVRACADQVKDQDGRLCNLGVVGQFVHAFNPSMIPSRCSPPPAPMTTPCMDGRQQGTMCIRTWCWTDAHLGTRLPGSVAVGRQGRHAWVDTHPNC
jgi:hypothetical protein